MKNLTLSFLVAVLALVNNNLSAQSAETLDQSSQPTASGIAIDGSVNDGQENYQTFTAGLSGALSKVDLYFRHTGNGQSGNLSIAIVTCDADGYPTNNVIATSNFVTIPTSDISGSWYSFTFANPPQINVGQKYAIRENESSNANYLAAIGTGYSFGNGYVGSIIVDYILAFRTYITQSTLHVLESTKENPSIYPNPAKEVVNVFSKTKNSPVQIYDVNGRLVKNLLLKENWNAITINDLHSGIYFLTIDGKTSKLVVK